MAGTRAGQKRYPTELRERATKMVLDLRAADPNDHSVINRVSRQLGIGGDSLRSWVKLAEVESGQRPGLNNEERDELKRLRKEVRELQRANDILQAAATFFGAKLERQQIK
jgi:transposase